MKQRRETLFWVLGAMVLCTFAKVGMDILALGMKTGLYSMAYAIGKLVNVHVVGVTDYVEEGVKSFKWIHFALEGIVLGPIVLWIWGNRRLDNRPVGYLKRTGRVVIWAILFEVLAFCASWLQLVGGATWTAIRSNQDIIETINTVKSSRWYTIDYLLRLCEGWLMVRVLMLRKKRED